VFAKGTTTKIDDSIKTSRSRHMKRQILFIQGGGTGAHKADNKLVASLQRALGTNYEVRYPKMPNEDAPSYEDWKVQINKEIAALDGELELVGHSVGGYILIKYLCEEGGANRPITGIYIIAAPFPGGDENWQFEGFSLPENFGARLPAEANVYLYQSRDDETVPFAHLSLYGKAIPRAIVRETSGGHQLNDDLSLVAKDIKDL
jgi:predicted alpha/beta hydrolase family esterase